MFSFAPKSGISETSQTQLVKIERKSVEKKKKSKAETNQFQKASWAWKAPSCDIFSSFQGIICGSQLCKLLKNTTLKFYI